MLFITLLIATPFLGVCIGQSADILEHPQTQYILVGSTITLHCKTFGQDAFWLINNTAISETRPNIKRRYESLGFFVGDSNHGMWGYHNLTMNVSASENLSNTMIECIVLDHNFHQIKSNTAYLYVFTDFHNFTIIPIPLNKSVEQREAVFHCQHRSSDDISWTVHVNGTTRISSLNVNKTLLIGGGLNSTISIETHPDFNGTTIQCVASFFQKSPPFMFSEPVTLLIQDIPGRVSNISIERSYYSNVLITLWDPLPTLDLTDINPDIIYTVEIFEITCSQNISRSLKDASTNGATMENLDLMQIYKVVISARNNVIGARNGPSVEMEELFVSLHGSILFELARKFQINITSHEPVPSYYSMILKSLDGLGSSNTINITMERYGETITMGINEELPSKSLWEALILPYGCETDIVATELSTHDIQNITVSSQHTGQIRVMGDFVDGSSATGIFLIVYSLSNESDVHYIAKRTEQNYNIREIDVNVTNLSVATYNVSAYALEDGLPFPRVVTQAKTIIVANNGDELAQEQNPVIYELHPSSMGACITCTFLDTSTTDCVAVVHRRISQLSLNGLMNIESSHKFSRSGDTAYGCIDGVNLEQHQIGVVGVRNVTPKAGIESTSFCLGCILGACAAMTILIIATSLALVIYAIKRYYSNKDKRQSPTESEVNVEMQDCGAYEVVRLSRQKVIMKDNPAYVDVNLHTCTNINIPKMDAR